MKLHLISRPVFALAASAVLALAAPCVSLRAQQPSPGPTETDVFDVIKRGADRLQKQAREAKELAPKVKLLEERQNETHKKLVELEKKLAAQQELIDHLHKCVEKLEAVKPAPPAPPVPPSAADSSKPAPPPTAADPSKPVPPLPTTEPPVKP